jgi:hypothetical protein
MSKFLLNLLLQISKALVNSKIQFYSKIIFPQNLAHPAEPRPCWPAPYRRPRVRMRSAHPGLHGLGIIAKSCLYFEFALPGDDAFSLCHRQLGPTCQIHLLPRAGRPWSEIPHASP